MAWASSLLAGIVSHREKRNIKAIEHYNPARLDKELMRKLFKEYGESDVAERVDRLDDGLDLLSYGPELPWEVDLFAESLVNGTEDFLNTFANRFYFGCEADDPMNALAFASELNTGNVTLPAIFASDIGHWDVPDIRGVVPEAYSSSNTATSMKINSGTSCSTIRSG